MNEAETFCFYCGEVADLLCDGILGYLKATRIVKGQIQERIDTQDLTKSIFSCDRPLCRACVANAFIITFCGKKPFFDTRDYCAQCVAEGRINAPTGQELFTLEDVHAFQKRRQFHPAPAPTALERARATIVELERQLAELRGGLIGHN